MGCVARPHRESKGFAGPSGWSGSRVNPALAELEHPFQRRAYVRRQGRGQPEPAREMALPWRHPERLVTMFLAANKRSLLTLKLAVEGLTPPRAAAATGVAEAGIRATVESCVAGGLVLSP